MNTYLLVKPETHTLELAPFATYKDAVVAVGLDPLELDHGSLGRRADGSGLAIWVFEYGLMRPKVNCWFALDKQLFNGPAVIFAFDSEGETSNISEGMADHILSHHIHWFDSLEEIETAIASGALDRPQTLINNEVVWEWNKGEVK